MTTRAASFDVWLFYTPCHGQLSTHFAPASSVAADPSLRKRCLMPTRTDACPAASPPHAHHGARRRAGSGVGLHLPAPGTHPRLLEAGEPRALAREPMDAPGSTAVDSPPKSPTLSRRELAVCLAIALAIFFFHQGPFWRHRWELDAAIGYSYLAIPIIVAAVLAYRRKLALRALALGTLEVTCWKFALTYLIAHTVWMFSNPSPRPAAKPAPLPDAPATAAPTRQVSVDQAGSIEGALSDAAALPMAGAVAFIESGVEEYAFDPAPTHPTFSVRMRAIEPLVSVAELHEEVRAHSVDGKLHTLIASQGDTDLFNLPLQSSGAFSAAEIRRGHGVVKLRCAVHERSGEQAQLVVLTHPFHAVLDETGRFEWSGIPAGRITLDAIHPDGRVARADHDVVAGSLTLAKLTLPSERPADQ